MYAFEFKTKIKNGMIEIPEKFREKLKNNVKVILLTEYIADTQSDIIEELLESPLKIIDFSPVKEKKYMSEVERNDKGCFIDSNIWLYAFIETPDKSLIAKSLIKGSNITISTQVINEVCVNLIRKALYPEEKIRNLIESFYNKYNILEINREILPEEMKIISVGSENLNYGMLFLKN